MRDFLFPENKISNIDIFIKENTEINYKRLRIISLVVSILFIILTVVDIYERNSGYWENINNFNFLFYFKICNIAVSIGIFFISYLLKSRIFITLSVLYYLLWSCTFSLWDLPEHNQTINLMVTSLCIASISILNTVNITIVYLITLITFNIFITDFTSDPEIILFHRKNVTIFILLSWFISRFIYQTIAENFTSKKTIQDLNKTLTEKVDIRNEQLIKAERMASLGLRTAEIIHNIKNPLFVVKGYTELLLSEDPKNNYGLMINTSLEKLEKIIKNILKTSKTHTVECIQEVNLNEMIEDELQLFRTSTTIKYKPEIKTEYKEIPNLRVNPSHLSQTLGNFIKNANEAMIDCETKILNIKTDICDNTVVIKISDTGTGIETETIDKIFDPFYTTKQGTTGEGQTEGTGLGLSSAKGIIEAYGGKILVESIINKGTTFTIHLPVN